MKVYVVEANWGFEDEECQWRYETKVMEVFVNEPDAKRYVAYGEGKTLEDYGMGYANYPQIPIHFQIHPRTLRTGWRR